MSTVEKEGRGKQNWIDMLDDQDNDQSAGLPDFKDVKLLRFKDVLESPEEFEEFESRVKMTLRAAGLAKLIDKTKDEPEQDAPSAQNWFALSKLVASWICTNMTQEVFEKCRNTGKRILLATEIWDVLESIMVGDGVFVFVNPIREFFDMKSGHFPEPSVFATEVLEEYCKITTNYHAGTD
ncbi:hypothetical protein N7466_006750 [Penicillium verhagenii]|uniref:uncharacterized protein n=1 Tax=Penicillium verhagenii TaxID=1562060 RepID=UPI002545B89E|nr:uncharacterized protein N7466_006750 [Penicillium verhagenii]KAJ5927794.1 hypothetical protein N7466_006750 [Penicillium verhagenii]